VRLNLNAKKIAVDMPGRMLYSSTMMKVKKDLASTKLARPFLIWLKIEAIRKGVPMYELVEMLVARGKVRPWNMPTR